MEELSQVPIIDFGPFIANSSDADRQRVANEIGQACRDLGFFYLSNHGVSQEVVNRANQQVRLYFAQPIEDKMCQFIRESRTSYRGYTPMLEEKISAKGDLKEAFDFSRELPEDDEDRLRGASLYGPNVWPKNMPEFRRILYDEYYVAMERLANQLLKAFAMALSLPLDVFAPFTRKPICDMRIVRYPPQPIVLDADQLGCGAHTDYGCFTLISQLNEPGLQVKSNSGKWIDAEPIEDTFVVNIADLMQMWTNGEFKSNLHRVINKSGRERYAIAYFYRPDYFARIQCLKQPAKYEPILVGEYLFSRLSHGYGYDQSKK